MCGNWPDGNCCSRLVYLILRKRAAICGLADHLFPTIVADGAAKALHIVVAGVSQGTAPPAAKQRMGPAVPRIETQSADRGRREVAVAHLDGVVVRRNTASRAASLDHVGAGAGAVALQLSEGLQLLSAALPQLLAGLPRLLLAPLPQLSAGPLQ